MNKTGICISISILYAVIGHGLSQQLPMKTLSLDDLSSFQPEHKNWKVIGDIIMTPPITIQSKKPGKKKQRPTLQQSSEFTKPVIIQPGKGILLNESSGGGRENLISIFNHGDIELEFEIMLSRHSKSGMFLQGRYEISLSESWGIRYPKYADMGGVSGDLEMLQGKMGTGKPPSTNAEKAPGLWQKVKISFRAPVFDTSGKKVSNAKFIFIELNGVKIHENIEAPIPTNGALENNEKATGPLMIRSDSGMVAFRNIKYNNSMKNIAISLSPLYYKAFHGSFVTVSDFISTVPIATGIIPELTYEVVNTDNAYGAIFTGSITVPEDNTYEFQLNFSGGAKLVVNNEQIVNFQRADAWYRKGNGFITLKAGVYPIEIYNYKNVPWVAPRLALYVKTDNSYPQPFYAYNSYPPDDNPISTIFVNPEGETRLLRAFIDFKGNRSERLTHTIGVGDLSGIHYIYDLSSGNIVCAWRGGFIDATPMWYERGDGSFKPRGATQYFFINQPLCYLTSEADSFPTFSNKEQYRGKGYEIDPRTGRPLFKYIYMGMEVTDKIYPDEANHGITHEVIIKDTEKKQNLYYKIAEGSSILALKNNIYIIDDKQYYVKIVAGEKAVIREVSGKMELMIPFFGNPIVYSITW